MCLSKQTLSKPQASEADRRNNRFQLPSQHNLALTLHKRLQTILDTIEPSSSLTGDTVVTTCSAFDHYLCVFFALPFIRECGHIYKAKTFPMKPAAATRLLPALASIFYVSMSGLSCCQFTCSLIIFSFLLQFTLKFRDPLSKKWLTLIPGWLGLRGRGLLY